MLRGLAVLALEATRLAAHARSWCARVAMGVVAASGVLAIALIHGCTCAEPHRPARALRCCPLLVREGAFGTVSYGAFAARERFPPGACVELYQDGDRIGQEYASLDGSLVMQFVVLGNADGARFELRVSDASEVVLEVVPLVFDTTTYGLITYPEGSSPLIARAGALEFNGSLRTPRDGEVRAIDSVWMVNWTRGTINPLPPGSIELGVDFTARVGGVAGDCASPVSAHGDGAGGCWWPRGGGECSSICTWEEHRMDDCRAFGSGGCTGRGDCILDVDERRSGARPETDDMIPVAPPPPGPVDSGTDTPPDTPPDVPPLPDTPEDVWVM